ncbi:PREDICTED: serine protease gd-like, partial [Wasmannia auropunctata]|uniref:serine protease gd-like n=1 Tax=Wasmannia auropunctata TaxID=64793 RepID=UPI0005F04E97
RQRGTVNREVASYRIHPDYTHDDSGGSDLAILTLRTPIEYNQLIRPICLWPADSTDLNDIVIRMGYVAGWGQDELGNAYTLEPRMARVPIVSQVICLQSQVFIALTSDRTLCAGLRDQSGPCNGDSGTGLVLYNITGHYQLRGIVSRSMTNGDYLCDLKKYIVYIDVAKYIPWIQEQICTK